VKYQQIFLMTTNIHWRMIPCLSDPSSISLNHIRIFFFRIYVDLPKSSSNTFFSSSMLRGFVMWRKINSFYSTFFLTIFFLFKLSYYLSFHFPFFLSKSIHIGSSLGLLKRTLHYTSLIYNILIKVPIKDSMTSMGVH